MTHQNTQITVFVSCPGDVEKEKTVVKRVCEKVNRMLQDLDCHVFLVVKDWREIVGSYGERPQTVINETFKDYDIYLGILHMRFGSPTGKINEATGEDFGSGTVEEFTLAFDKWKDDHDAVKVYMFFKHPSAPSSTDATLELLKVQQFRDRISPTGWVNSFQETEEFKDKIDAALTTYAMQLCIKKKGSEKIEVVESLQQDEEQPLAVAEFTSDIDFSGIGHYIARTVSPFKNKQPNDLLNWMKTQEENKTLAELVLKSRRIILLGNAGAGKSTELAKLAQDCQNALIPFIPVYKRFNTYVDQEIGTFLPDGWQRIPPGITLLILDGLDEVQPQHFNSAVRRIQAFADKYPNITIVVGCRTNFYELPDQSDTTTLDGFAVYFIDDIDMQGIQDYATAETTVNVTNFLNESYREGYQDLVGKPFFLKLLLQSYEDKNSLTGGRQFLFEHILQSRIELDKKHFKTSIELAGQRKKIIAALERIALVMEALGTNIISFEALEEILPVEQLGLLKYYPGFTKTRTSDHLWAFEHNNIQEYLAARALSSQPFETIRKFIGVPPGWRKIKLRWTNTLSFLISILDNPARLQVLLDWLIEIEPEVVVRFEPLRVPVNLRMRIFRQIFDKAKQRGIWLRSNKFSEKELAQFSESPESFDFLIQELENESSGRVILINSMHLLKYFLMDESQRELLLNVIYHLIDRFTNDFELLHSILYLIRDLARDDKQVIDIVMRKLGSYTNQYVRAGIYGLLAESKWVNDYVDYLLTGITVSQKDTLGQRTSVNLADESWNLKRAIEQIDTAPALEKVLQYFSNPDDRRHVDYFDRPDIVKKIIENASKIYDTQPGIYESVLRFFTSHGRYSRKGILERIQPFFDQTGTRLRAFKDVWKEKLPFEKQYEKRILLLNIASKATLDYVLLEYANHNVTNDEIIQLFNDLTHYRLDIAEDKEMVDYFEQRILEETSIDLAKPEIFDYSERHRQRNQQSFDLLFDQKGFEKELRRFYKEVEKESVDFNDLWEFTKDNHVSDPEDFFPRCVLDLLRDWTRDKNALNENGLTLEKVIGWMNEDHNFVNYSMEQAYEHLKNYKEIVVSPEQLDTINTWCNSAIDELDAAKMVSTNQEQRSFTLNWKAKLIWFFLSRLEVELQKEKLLDFTVFVDVDRRNGDPTELTVLEKYVPVADIRERVIQNLNSGIDFSLSWKNNANYAVANDLTEAYPGIVRGIKDSSKYMNDRLDVYNAYLTRTKDQSLMKDVLEHLSLSELSWTTVDRWLKYNFDQTFLIAFLKKVMTSQSSLVEYQLKAAEQLIELGDADAFFYYTDQVLAGKIIDRDYPRRLQILSQVSEIKFVPRLMELMLFSKRPEFINDHFRSFDQVVISALSTIALLSDHNFETVVTALKKFIADNPSIHKIEFMHMSIEKIEFDFYTKKSQSATLPEVIAEVDTIRPLQ